MNKNLMIGLFSSFALLSITSGCSDDYNPISSTSGKIEPRIDLNSETIRAAKAGARDASAISVSDLALKLTSADGQLSQSWTSVNEFDVEKQFKVGAYTMEASYGSVEDEGFEKPYYYGSAPLTVRENQVTPVALTAKLANTMVSVEYTDAFKNYFNSYSLQLHSDGGAYVNYAADEARPAYLRPGKVTILATVVKPNGVGATLEAASFVAQAQHHYSVTLDVNGGNVGDAQLVITFDELIDQEEITIDLSDELLSAPAPQLIAEGFDPAASYTVVDGMESDLAPKFNVIARGGIASVTLTTESKSLIEQGWPAEIDLVAADAARKAKLESLGLVARGVFGNVDKMAVIDLTGVMPSIRYHADGNDIKITVVVKDKIGKVTEPMSLNLTCEPVIVELSNPSVLTPGADNVDVQLAYNGSDVAGKVKIEYKNERGTWTATSINSVTAAARSTATYTLNVAVPATDGDVVLRAVCGKQTSNELTFTREVLPFELTGSDNDVFATHAFVTVVGEDGTPATLPAGARIVVSTDGENYSAVDYTADGSMLELSGLTPSTSYTARVFGSDKTKIYSFTTEADTQIPFSGFDNWYNSDSGSHWVRSYVGSDNTESVWGTNNYMTTEQGSNYAYVRISGTIEDSNGHNGSAALLRTVGWGSGNTAVSSDAIGSGLLGKGTCKYTDPGLLHIGATRSARPSGYGANDNKVNDTSTGPVTTDDLNCGMDFASRPASMSFWYKYSPKNPADKGYAEIWVKDAEGNILSRQTVTLDAVSSFTEKTVALSYQKNAAKGARLYVKFLSSYDMEYIKRTNDNLSGPGRANLSNGTYMGSQLWIDDVKLNY